MEDSRSMSGSSRSEDSNELKADRGDAAKGALQRTAILSNEKYRGIRLDIRDSGVVLQAHNPEQEEAEEELEVEYSSGEDMEIGFNVNYLLDALGAVESDDINAVGGRTATAAA